MAGSIETQLDGILLMQPGRASVWRWKTLKAAWWLQADVSNRRIFSISQGQPYEKTDAAARHVGA